MWDVKLLFNLSKSLKFVSKVVEFIFSLLF